MKTEVIKFKNRDGLELSARLEKPLGKKPEAFAVFAHCFTCSKNLKAIKNISNGLTLQGIAVLRFDFTGLGESEGEFAETNFSSNVNDLIDAAEFLKEKYKTPSILVGHSLGGAAVIFAAAELEPVKAVVTIGSPFEPEHVKNLVMDDVDTINEKGEAEVSIGGRPFTIKKQFLDDIESFKIKDVLNNLNKALLVLHSPRDFTVPIDNAAKIYKAAKHPKSFITLDDADHLLSEKEDSLYAGQVIGSWVSRYINKTKREDLQSPNQVVVRIGSDSYTSEVKAGVHNLIADEPEDVKGGNDLGPSPYDYLIIALGSCTAMTLRMYAERKNWDLREVRVHLNHKKKHADDCNSCENSDEKIDHIERIIELEGELDDDERNRLLEIAEKCPVHKTLRSEIKVDSKLS